MMEQMTINDLKTGMHVVTRDGSEWVVLRDTMFRDKDILVAVHEDDKCGNWLGLNRYNQNMTTIDREFDDFDIVRVYQPVYECTTLKYKLDTCPDSDLVNMLFAEEIMTKAEAEQKFGIRIID
jgi:hypothetical protein